MRAAIAGLCRTRFQLLLFPELLGVRYAAFFFLQPQPLISRHAAREIPSISPKCDPSVCSKTAGNRLFKAEKNEKNPNVFAIRIDRRVFCNQ